MKRIIYILFFAHVSLLISAQQSDYYSCNFEDDAINGQWVLNPGQYGNSIQNRWYIGNAVNFGGNKSLYISANGGDSAYYVTSSSGAVAYVELDLAAGEYILSFDWKAQGLVTNGFPKDVLFVAWIPETEEDVDANGYIIQRPININTSPSGSLPDYIREYRFQFDDVMPHLFFCPIWKNQQVNFTTNGQKYRLVFFWLSSASGAINPGACVDNILIMRKDLCPPPVNLLVEEGDETLKLTWSGEENAHYNLRVYNHTSEQWLEFNLTDTTYTLADVQEGLNSIYIRQACKTDDSGTVLYGVPLSKQTFSYFASRHCGIDYLNLNKDNCFISDAKSGYGSTTTNVFFNKGIVDYGPYDPTSRHTVNYDLYNLIDPLTIDSMGYALKVIPNGEFASVRLGNWCNGHEAERIEYNILVDTLSNPILLLQYAVVLEYPNHEDDVNPRFEVKILDKIRNPILNSECFTIDIKSLNMVDDPMFKEEGWHYLKQAPISVPSQGDGSGERTTAGICWKDWTQVGIDLSKYHGKEIILQLSTYDCAYSAHFGYAYFVLDCFKSKWERDLCSGDMQISDFTAPSGFDYRWYLVSDYDRVHDYSQSFDESLIISRERTFVDDYNDEHYAVDCMFSNDSSCFFTLYAHQSPISPKAVGLAEVTQDGNQNIVHFVSNCYLKNVYDATVNVIGSCDSVIWDFGDGTYSKTTKSVDHIYPDEGGQFEARLYAFYQSCVDSVVFHLNLPPVNSSGIEHVGADPFTIPTSLICGQHIQCHSSGVVSWINVLGIVVSQQYYTPESGIVVPMLGSGYYMISLEEKERHVLNKVLIKQ